MLIVMHRDATDAQIRRVMDRIESLGFRAHSIPGSLRTAIGITGNQGTLPRGEFDLLPGVDQAISVTKPYKLVNREAREERTCVNVAGVPIGEGTFTVIAGPCAVESREQLFEVARQVKRAGAHLLRGGAFKPRTSRYSFQGLGEEGLRLLAAARREFDLPVVTEAMDSEGLKLVEEYADAIQIGARNMQNYSLLKAAGRARKPVFLKRGMSATLDELLMAAEYICSEGNYQVFLCERGVRTFSTHTRNTLDLSVVPAVHEHSHLPILVDTSHGTGRRDKVPALSLAALAVGSDGLMVEVHHEPEKALSDGPQALFPEMFSKLMADLKAMAPLVGRTLYNLKIGSYQVDVLRCGQFRLDGGAMFGVVPRVVWERLTPPDEFNRIRLQTNCLLIRGEGVTILVDTGVGDKEDDSFRERFAVERGEGVPGALHALGLTPEDVTHVAISHLHWDHAGGATRRDDNGKLVPAFPRARYVVQRGEWRDAVAPSERTRASYMPDNFMPLEEADCLQLVDGETEIAPGVSVFLAPGHNRHMQCIRVESAGETGVFLADLVPTRHHLRLAFIMGYDLYPATTLETKREILGSIHAGGWFLFFDHDPEVPVATLDRDERGHFVAVPVTS